MSYPTRFYSHWIHFVWLYRCIDIYYPFSSKKWNTATLFLYGMVAACDYANRMYPKWHTRLHAVGEDEKVADKFSLFEFGATYCASVASVYWILDNHLSTIAWVVILALAWFWDYMLERAWDKHISRLRYAAYGHVP